MAQGLARKAGGRAQKGTRPPRWRDKMALPAFQR